MDQQIQVELVEGMQLNALTRGYDGVIPLDSDASVGGQGNGHRPLQMLLVGLIGCMAMDSISILRKKRQEFDHFKAYVQSYEQNEDHPHYYTKINLHFEAGGTNISEEALARSLELSYEKYCPAAAMLMTKAEINYTYAIVTQTEPA